jgi:uncharacterized protein
MAKAQMQVYKDNGGKFRFRLVAANGETVASSEAYAEKRGAMQTAKRIAVIASKAMMNDMTVEPKAPKAAAPKKK